MKKQKIFLKNKQLLGFYLVVGVLFSVISVVAPSISGELVNAVIYRQGDVKVYLFLLVLTYILLLLFSIADQYFFQYFQIKEKNAMRNELFQASLKRGNQEKEQIAAFTSFVNNDVPNIVENYYGGTVDIIKCVCIIICVALELFQIHWLLAVIIFGSSILIIMIPNIMRGYASKNRKNYGEALEKFNAVQQSLLSGAETVKVCLYRSNAKRMIENKNNEIEKEEKRLRNCQVSVYGLAGGMQILKRFLILAVGVYLIYRNIIKVGGLLVAVQLAEVLAAPAETLAYLLNAKNEARPLVEKYEQLAETEEDRGKTDINDIEDICVEHLSYGRNGVKIIKDVSFTFEKGKWKINVFEINRKTTGRYISGKYPHQRHFTGRDKYGFFIWKDGNRISGAVFIWIFTKRKYYYGAQCKRQRLRSNFEKIKSGLFVGTLLRCGT